MTFISSSSFSLLSFFLLPLSFSLPSTASSVHSPPSLPSNPPPRATAGGPHADLRRRFARPEVCGHPARPIWPGTLTYPLLLSTLLDPLNLWCGVHAAHRPPWVHRQAWVVRPISLVRVRTHGSACVCGGVVRLMGSSLGPDCDRARRFASASGLRVEG